MRRLTGGQTQSQTTAALWSLESRSRVENVATANKKPQRIDEGDEPDWPTKTKQGLADGRSIVNVTWFCENYGSRRIAKKLTQVSRWAAMERGLRECGIDEDEIERTMGELMGAFKESDTAGQQKWSTIRKAVVRRRSEADAFAHARKVEAEVVKKFVGDRRSEPVSCWPYRAPGPRARETPSCARGRWADGLRTLEEWR